MPPPPCPIAAEGGGTALGFFGRCSLHSRPAPVVWFSWSYVRVFVCLCVCASVRLCACAFQPQWMLFPSLSHAVMMNLGKVVVALRMPSSMVEGALGRPLSGVPDLPVEARTVGTCILDYMVQVLVTASGDQLPFLHHLFVSLLLRANNKTQKVCGWVCDGVCVWGGGGRGEAGAGRSAARVWDAGAVFFGGRCACGLDRGK